MNENTNTTCAICGCTNEELYALPDGRMVCRDCLDREGYTVCVDCGAVISEDDATYVEGVGDVCEFCRDDNYSYCEHCGDYVANDDILVINRNTRYETYACRSCVENSDDVHECEDCGELFSGDYIAWLEGVDRYICHNCQDNYSYCENCDNYVNSDDIIYDDDSGEYLCRDCYDELHSGIDERHKLQSYGYKPTPKPRTRKRNCTCDTCSDIPDLLFGIELEVDKGPYDERDTAISEIADASEDVYMKHDGSLDTGFEIVTHPCTLEYHMYEFKWRHITSIAKRHGFKSHDARTCGLHVHVGRYQLGQNDRERHNNIAKIIMLVDRHWDALVKFSRRRPEQLNHWAKRPAISPIRSTDTEDRIIDRMWYADNGDRYQAVNLRNSGTIEFRMFNGTLKRDTIIATVQLLSNICQYAMTHTPQECLASTWDDITTYRMFEELKAYCESNSLVGIDSPVPVTLGQPPINVGDRVRFGNREGTIICYIPDNDLPYGVQFGADFDGHNLMGRIDTRTGWWCSEEDLERIA